MSGRIRAVFVTLAGTGLLGLAAVMGPQLFAQADKPATPPEGSPGRLGEFMRVKLAASNKVLEGLALEDMDLVQEGAAQLNKMSSAEKWRVFNDTAYQQFSSEFQRNTNDLMKAARDNNLDQAALKWMAATMNCIECHRFVRSRLIADSGSSSR